VKHDYQRARELYEQAAEHGHAAAQAALAYMVENGLGGESDDVEALKWYLLSAEKWNAANNHVYFMSKKMDKESVKEAKLLAQQYKEKYYK
jgi:TPR repeat protein